MDKRRLACLFTLLFLLTDVMVDNGNFGSRDIQPLFTDSDDEILKSSCCEKYIFLPFFLSNIH